MTYEQAAKKANSQVLGSTRAPMTLTGRTTRVRSSDKMRNRERGSLLLLKCLVFYTGLVLLNTGDHLGALFGGQEPGVRQRAREEEPEEYRGDAGQDTGDGDQPLPGFETWGFDVDATEGK